MRAIEVQAGRDDADALLVLGWMYAAGFAKHPDITTARTLYLRAQARGLHARQGNVSRERSPSASALAATVP